MITDINQRSIRVTHWKSIALFFDIPTDLISLYRLIVQPPFGVKIFPDIFFDLRLIFLDLFFGGWGVGFEPDVGLVGVMPENIFELARGAGHQMEGEIPKAHFVPGLTWFALTVHIEGEKHPPVLSRSKVDPAGWVIVFFEGVMAWPPAFRIDAPR